MGTHKDLRIWIESMELVTDIYKVTAKFPKEEMYGLSLQIRRSAVSVPSNIAEGTARNSKKETIQFLHVSLGSLTELETQLLISHKIGYLDKIIYSKLDTKISKLIGMTRSFIKHLTNQPQPQLQTPNP